METEKKEILKQSWLINPSPYHELFRETYAGNYIVYTAHNDWKYHVNPPKYT